MSELTKRISSNSLLVLAILFVVYHTVSVVFGASSFLKLLTAPDATVAQVESNAVRSDNTPGLLTEESQIIYGYTSSEKIWPTRVVIDQVGIDLDLEGSLENQGTWNISENGANFAINTAVPNGISGNTAIFGHDRPHLFRNIHHLNPGDQVKVLTVDAEYTYKVTGSKVVQPTDISVMDQTEQPTLTLITCDGWLSQERYVVTASLDEVKPLK